MAAFREIMSAELALQKSRLILWAAICFASGIGFYFSVTHEPLLLLVAVSTVLFGIVWGYGYYLKGRESYGIPVWLIGGAVFFFCIGMFNAQLRTERVYAPMLVKALGPVDIVGTIESIEIRESGSRVVLKDLEVEKLSAGAQPAKVRLVMRKDEGIDIGDRISVLARLNPPSPPVAPGAFDFQRYAYFRQIGAVGFAYHAPEIIEKAHGKAFFKTLQLHIAKRIQNTLEEPASAFAMTLLTGQRGAITEEDKQAMRDAGLAHLLAISGMHVGMVAGILFFFSRLLMALWPRFALYHPIKKYAAAFAMVGIIFYALLVGASVPTQRALIMTGIILLAIMVDRSPFSLRVVGLAAIAVLVIAPESLMSVSFQMSFSAVIALISFFDGFRPQISRLYSHAGVVRRALLYLGGIVVTTIIAELAIGPFALFHFQHLASYSLMGNILAVPIMGLFIMPGLVFALLLMPIGLDFIPLHLAGLGIDWMVAAAHWTSSLDGAVLNLPAFAPLGLLFLVIGGLFLCFGLHYVRLLSVPFFIAGVVAALITPRPDILISAKADLIAVRDEAGRLVVSTRRKDKYAAENWLRLNGEEGVKPELWPKEGREEGLPLSCDPSGCRGVIKGHKISIAHEDKAWQEDCGWAEILVSSVPVEDKSCAASYIIDRFSVWRNGAYSVYLQEKKPPRVVSVRDVRGDRLWAAMPNRNSNRD
jgi:competence protein ComEC